MRVQGPDQTRAQWPCQSMPVLFTAVHSGGLWRSFGFRDAKLVPEMHGTRPFASRKPTCAGSPRILLFYDFTISVLYYSTMYYFTVNYSTICYSTTTPAVCISETDLRRFTQDFTILLPRPQPFGYFTILLYHDPSRLHLANPPLQVVL